MATAAPPKTETETKTPPPRGQLAFHGFPIQKARVKVSGTTYEIELDETDEYKLGAEFTLVSHCRVVKNNNHLLTEDGESMVDLDIVVYQSEAHKK